MLFWIITAICTIIIILTLKFVNNDRPVIIGPTVIIYIIILLAGIFVDSNEFVTFSEQYEIYSLTDGSSISGKFHLFGGYVESDLCYYSYYLDENNRYNLIKMPSNSKIEECDSLINNGVVQIYSHDIYSSFLPFDIHRQSKSHLEYIIKVPKNTIVKQFTVGN